MKTTTTNAGNKASEKSMKALTTIFDLTICAREMVLLPYTNKIEGNGNGTVYQKQRLNYFREIARKRHSKTQYFRVKLTMWEILFLVAYWADESFNKPTLKYCKKRLKYLGTIIGHETVETIKRITAEKIISQSKYEDDTTFTPPTDYDREQGK